MIDDTFTAELVRRVEARARDRGLNLRIANMEPDGDKITLTVVVDGVDS